MKMELPKYAMVEKEDMDYYGFKLQEGKFEDVIYYYGEVKIEEDEENDTAYLNFKFQVAKGNDTYNVDELNESSEFKTLIGDILATLLDNEDNTND